MGVITHVFIVSLLARRTDPTVDPACYRVLIDLRADRRGDLRLGAGDLRGDLRLAGDLRADRRLAGDLRGDLRLGDLRFPPVRAAAAATLATLAAAFIRELAAVTAATFLIAAGAAGFDAEPT